MMDTEQTHRAGLGSGLGYGGYANDVDVSENTPTTGGLDPAAYLRRFGWGQGQGLGKNNSGIKTFVRVSKKEDNHGIGPRQDWHTSWDDVFNQASKNVGVETKEGGEVVLVSTPKSSAPSAVADIAKVYGSFVSSSSKLQMDEKTTKGSSVDPICAGVEKLAQIKGGHHMYCGRVAGKLKRLQMQEAGLSRSAPASVSSSSAASSEAVQKHKRPRGDTASCEMATTALRDVAIDEKERKRRKKEKKEKKKKKKKKEKEKRTEQAVTAASHNTS